MLRYLLCLFGCIILLACKPAEETESRLNIASILGERDVAGFARAVAVREFHFPQDHGSHPEFKNEWWYITGNLADQQGRRFGYQLTFFRLGLEHNETRRQSAWATNHLWMAHAAVTDVSANEHLSAERFSRGNPGMAGAQWQPFQVWLDDWQLAAINNEFPWQVKIKTQSFAFEFILSPQKDIVLQGEQGLSRKSETPGNASYYYSITRLTTTGKLSVNNQIYQLDGLSWLDREWGTSSLDKDQKGWDWFSLQLNSGEDLMYYQLREKSAQGRTKPHTSSQGTWISKNSEIQTIHHHDIRLTPLDWWLSEQGERYPIRWQMEYLTEQKNWIIEALVEGQKMNLSVSYWEGAVAVYDYDAGTHLGNGYLEMTGY